MRCLRNRYVLFIEGFWGRGGANVFISTSTNLLSLNENTTITDIITAITSLVKGHGSLSLGNIIGANLFNLVLVSGISIAINPFEVPASGLINGINSSFVLDIPVMLLVMGILTIPTLIKQKLSRWQGILMLGIYVAFVGLSFVIGAN